LIILLTKRELSALAPKNCFPFPQAKWMQWHFIFRPFSRGTASSVVLKRRPLYYTHPIKSWVRPPHIAGNVDASGGAWRRTTSREGLQSFRRDEKEGGRAAEPNLPAQSGKGKKRSSKPGEELNRFLPLYRREGCSWRSVPHSLRTSICGPNNRRGGMSRSFDGLSIGGCFLG